MTAGVPVPPFVQIRISLKMEGGQKPTVFALHIMSIQVPGFAITITIIVITRVIIVAFGIGFVLGVIEVTAIVLIPYVTITALHHKVIEEAIGATVHSLAIQVDGLVTSEGVIIFLQGVLANLLRHCTTLVLISYFASAGLQLKSGQNIA